MDYSTADRLLRQVHYKPEYTLRWSQGYVSRRGGAFGNQPRPFLLDVEIEAIVPNSSDWPYYRYRSIAGGRFSIDLDLIPEHDHDRFYRIVLNNLIAWETHEAREFFRIGDKYHAPFHPHRPDGDQLWNDTGGRQPAERYAAA